QPSQDELESFYQIFITKINDDEDFKKIEVNALYKEAIFDIYDIVNDLKQDFKSISLDEIGLLRKEYLTQVDEAFEVLNRLKFKTALEKIEKLEQKIQSNLKTNSKELSSKIEYVKAICYDHIDKNNLAKECYIKAYMLNPNNLKNLEIACWV